MSEFIEHKIYISYANADEEWVIHFVKWLKIYLKQRLGQVDNIAIWGKYMLRGADDTIFEPKKRLKNADILFTILSNAYIHTNMNQEVIDFKENKKDSANIFVIEHDKVKRPKEIENIVGYRFWYEDERNRIFQMGVSNEHRYHRVVYDVVYDLVEEIRTLEIKQQKFQDINEEIIKPSTPTIYLGYVNDDLREQYNDLKRFFKNKGLRVLPERNYAPNDKVNLSQDLKNVIFFIQLGEPNDYTQIEFAEEMKISIVNWYRNTNIFNQQKQKIEDVQYNTENVCNVSIMPTDFETFKHDIIKLIEKEENKEKLEQYFVFVNADDIDKEIAQKIYAELENHSVTSSITLFKSDGCSNNEIEEWFDDNMLECDAVIIVFDEARQLWLNKQLLICRKIQNGRDKPLKIIAIFYRPPSKSKELSLPIQLPNMKVFTLNEMSETTSIFLKEVCV